MIDGYYPVMAARSDDEGRTSTGGLKSPYLDATTARFYAAASSPFLFDQPARDLAKYLKISDGQKILDIGSGTGAIATAAARLAGTSGSVFALDASVAMLKQQQKTQVMQLVGNAQKLSFNDATFDRIAAGFVITHLSDYRKGLSEWTRVLRSGGILAASTWETGGTKPADLWRATMQQFISLSFVEEEFRRVIPFDEFFSVRSNLTMAFEEAGLVDIEAITNNYLISMNVDQYIETKIGSVEGTIVRNHIAETSWSDFLAELTNNLEKVFPQGIEYTRNVHLVAGKKR